MRKDIKNKERREAVRLEMLVHGPYNLCAEARTERQSKQVRQGLARCSQSCFYFVSLGTQKTKLQFGWGHIDLLAKVT